MIHNAWVGRAGLIAALVLASALCPAFDNHKLEGKGQLIYSLTAPLDADHPHDPNTGKSSVRRNMMEYRLWQADPNNVTTDDDVHIDPGTGQQGTGPERFTRPEIKKFLVDTKAKWMAIKCLDGAKLLDQADADTIADFKSDGFAVFGWIVLKSYDDRVNEEKAAEKLVSDLKVDGIIVMPIDDPRAGAQTELSYYADVGTKENVKTLVKDFWDQLQTVCDDNDAVLAYAPEADILCINPDDPNPPNIPNLSEIGKIRAYVNYAFGKKADVVMPRFFWHGGQGDVHFGQFESLLQTKWKNDPASATAHHNALYNRPLVPIIQEELRSAKTTRMDKMADELKKTTGGPEPRPFYNVRGITAWVLDEFTIPDDFRAFFKISKEFPH